MYSDFRQQQANNPDGYAFNITTWETGLAHAARAGVIPGERNILSLKTGEELLQALETKEWGRPMALGAVVVGEHCLVHSRHYTGSLTAVPLGRSYFTWSNGAFADLS